MQTNIKVSVITVCYNSEKTIEATIQSVLKQTYSNIEYIIIDGASRDNTLAIIKKYEQAFEGRLRVVSEPDEGIYFAMNKGIKMATGEIIGLLNSDDTYEYDAIEKICNGMTKSKHQILYGFVRIFKDEQMDSITMVTHHFLKQRMFNHSACFVTKNIYSDFGMFNTRYKSVADYDFMLRMSEIKEIEFVPIYALVSNFYVGGISGTDFAYIDLQKMKKDHGMISKVKYYIEYLRYRLTSVIKWK